jgi:hypothetical protein
MKLSTLILVLIISIRCVYSQSSTIGVLYSGDLFLSTDNINTSVINGNNPYSPWGFYTTLQLEILQIGWIPVYTNNNNYPNRLGINYGFFRNGINLGVGGKMVLYDFKPAKFYPDVMVRLHPIKLITQNARSLDVSFIMNISNTVEFGAGLSIPFLLNRY